MTADFENGWQLAYRAARKLIEESGLACYHGSPHHFVACTEQSFEDHWQALDPLLGRYMFWLWFEVGGENLAKAACIREKLFTISDHVTMGKCLNKYLQMLPVANPGDLCTLRKGYKRLACRRNRDAHVFHLNERDAYFPW